MKRSILLDIAWLVPAFFVCSFVLRAAAFAFLRVG